MALFLFVVGKKWGKPPLPWRIVPALADEGVYLASESSIQRVLREHGQMRHRGRAKPPRKSRAPTQREGEFAISTTAGKEATSLRTLAGWAYSIVGDAIEGFQLKMIRSGVETLLVACGVSREVRGHLQSHGLTGVQARHYDGHDYMAEKRSALDVLSREIRSKAVA